MADDLLQHLAASLRAHGLLRPDARLLAAVSGGPDSLALLHLLARLRDAGGPQVIAAHLDHGFRGAESAADAAFVAAAAAAWGLPAHVERRDVPALARTWRLGPPAAARRARYAFLAEAARAANADALAVAHHADDQAETVLLHALRGAGPAGLRGMRPSLPWGEWSGQADAGPPLIRPLLAVTHAALLTYCAEHGLAPRDDPSNRDERYARPHLRHSLLPALERARPGAAAALARSAQICAEDYDFIQSQLDAAWPALVAAAPGALRLHGPAWEALHPALQRYALRRAAAALGQRELSMAQIEAARAVRPGHRLALGAGLLLEADQVGLTLRRPEAPSPLDGPQLPVDALPLPIPGQLDLGGGWRCLARREPPAEPSRWWAALDAGALDGPLLLRRRRAGERMRPAGGRGSRRLQDLMVDAKILAPLRAAWPLLATATALVWPAGLRPEARFAATAASRDTIWVGFVRADA